MEKIIADEPKNFIVNENVLISPKARKNKKVYQITDVHSDVGALIKAFEIAKNYRLDAIIITGDLIDSTNDPRNEKLAKVMRYYAFTLGLPIVVVKGNHDEVIFTKDENGKRKEEYSEDDTFFREISCYPNVHVVKDSAELIPIDNDIEVVGVNIPYNCYPEKDYSTFDIVGSINKLDIDPEKFTMTAIHYLNPEVVSLLSSLENALHEPSKLKDIQLFLSGHMHAGCTPIWLRQVLNHIKILNSRGLVGPYFSLGSKDAYGLILYDMIAAIISGGVTKFAVSSEAKGVGTKLNKVFVPETEIIDIIPGEDLQFIQESRKKMAA